MSRYPYLLFDADNTLFCFDKANLRAFEAVCEQCSLPFSQELFARYEAHNSALWAQFDRGEVSKDFLVLERFRRFFAELGVDADVEAANRVHLTTLSRSAFLMPYALEVVRTLHETHRLFLVTNAVAMVQRGRLKCSAIAPYIETAFISEEAGASKPSRAYFDYVFARIEGITKSNCLLIGDGLASDIRGANGYGLPCCWYNPANAPLPEGYRADYVIDDLRALYGIV